MKLKTNLLALLLLIIGTVALNAQTQTPVAVYTSTNTQYYRIPAIVTASNGDLLLFNDDRHTSNSDVGSNNSNSGIDLLVKRLNWDGSAYGSIGASLNVTPNKPQATWCYGDPAVVADRESDEVLVLAIGGTTSWTSNTTSYAIRSHNNGQTWDAPVQMTFGSANFPRPTDNYVNGFFFASGRILQSKVIKVGSYYRIYVAFLYTTNGTGDNTAKYNQVYYSDDFGSTWNLLGTAAQSYADEAKLEELPNGNLIISTRAAGGRYFNTFTYSDVQNGMGSWGTPRQFYRFTTNTSSTCTINGDMLTMTAYRKSDNQEVTLLLQSTITGRSNSTDAAESRKNVKIFYHEIDNNTTDTNLTSGWTATSFTLPNTSTFGGYSAMTMQADNMIGVYYEGNTTTNGVNDYSNLYYIAYTLEELTGNAYTLTNPNPPTVPGVEVPDGIVPIYQWQGSHSDRWSDPLNWTVINAVNNTPLARGMVPPTPDANSNVKILAPGAGEFNPVLETQLTVKNLYVAPGAAIGNQHLLRVGEKVYTDVEIPTNQWVRVSMPLRDTYSGDMYTTTQGGKILNGTTVLTPDSVDYYFTGATYDPVDGNSGNNRVFPYAIYQRVFSDAVNVMTDDQTGTEVRQLNSSWSVPYNDLAAKYQVAEGFDLWAPSTNATATFRFPSATDEYAYYYSNGNASTRKETVNHTASGTMAYGNSGNGVMDVTITRAKRAEDAGVPMYAVGNPSFSYLDIAEFIRVNAYGASHSGNASVVGNITPYVYKYNEDNLGSTGEAGETIYYLDNDKKLYTVSPTSVSDNTIPTGGTTTQVAANSTEKYIAPTRGFRVMAGQAEVSAVEPKLIGQYVNAQIHQAAVPFYSGTNQSGTAGVNKINYDAGNYTSRCTSLNGDGVAVASLALSVGSTPEKVLLQNFAGIATCEGTVDPVNQTIRIPGGQVVSFYNPGNWTGVSAMTNAVILGCQDKNLTYSYTNVNNHTLGYANNVSADNDIIIKYIIASESVSLELQNAFAIYVNTTAAGASLYTGRSATPASGLNDGNYYNAFDCFDAMTATLDLSTSEDAYICPEIFGKYRYDIATNYHYVTDMPGALTAGTQVEFEVMPIEGSYNVVKIHNLYPVPSGDTHGVDVIGSIGRIDDNQFKLTIPGGQTVYNGGDFATNRWVVYGQTSLDAWGTRNDLVLTFDKSHNEKYFTLGKTSSNAQLAAIQVSQLGSTSSSTSTGFRGTTVSFTVGAVPPTTTTSATVITSNPSNKDLLLYDNGQNTYIGYDGSDLLASSNQPSLTNNDYLFVLEASGKGYHIKNKNGKYLNVVSGFEWGSSASTTYTVNYTGNSGWTIAYTTGNGSKAETRYVYINNNTSLNADFSTHYWTFYEVTTTTTGGSAGTTVTGFPQIATWSGSTSGGSSTTGQFTPGTNYEAINLKYTPAMFNANPGYTPSASSAPRKTAAQGSTMASVTLKDGNRTANTLITRRENGHNGYNAFEDASLIDVNDNAKSIATLAGNQMVAVNTLGDTTAVQLVLNNANGNVALTFDNLAALGCNARLFDATTGSETPLDANHQELTVNMTVNDSPLRYSIIWDVVSGTEEVELPMTDGDLWFKAFSSAKGTIKVTSSENMASVRLYDSTGKLVGSKVNAQNETMFEYLLSGIYVVEVSNGSETQSMKVNVK